MSVIIDNIKNNQVRKMDTHGNEELYAVSISVCRSMSSDGFATFVCEGERISFNDTVCKLVFPKDETRTFKIKNNDGNYTTASIFISDVSDSYIASIEERKREREEARIRELNAKFHDTIYYAVYTKKNNKESVLHSYKSVEEVNSEVRDIVFKELDADLNRKLMKRSVTECDLVIFSEEGTLKMLRTTLKKSAFSSANNLGSVRENLYYVRNDKRMLITTWDWSEVIDEVSLKQIYNDDILHLERTEEEWKRIQAIASTNVKSRSFKVDNLTDGMMY
ncbi:MAG: hypothetical protein IKN80_07470 [Clostridiales bacterium]|nr:hypothetical protein [Clostridiales bacterium]